MLANYILKDRLMFPHEAAGWVSHVSGRLAKNFSKKPVCKHKRRKDA
jgi:hypothetical protein